MKIIKSYSEYKKALKEGRNVTSWNTYLGLRLMQETGGNPFIVISLDKGTYDIFCYSFPDNFLVLNNAICGEKHQINKILSDSILDNHFVLDLWREVFYQNTSIGKYYYDKNIWGQHPILAGEDTDFETLLARLSKEMEKWNLHSKINELTKGNTARPTKVFVTGQWAFCPPIAYMCQKFLSYNRPTIIPIDPEDHYPSLQAKFWIKKEFADKCLSIGQGLPFASLLNKPIRLTLPYPIQDLNEKAIDEVCWKDLIDEDLTPDYYLGGKPFIEIIFSGGSDADGNIWIESTPLGQFNEKLSHRFFLQSAEERFRPIRNDINSIRKHIIELNERAKSPIESLIKDIKDNLYDKGHLKYYSVSQLKDIKDYIDRLLDFDNVVTDTNVWCTSYGWDKEVTPENLKNPDPKIAPHPVLKFRDLIWTYAYMLHENNHYLDLEGHCFVEVEHHSSKAPKLLLRESAKEAKRDICTLQDLNLIWIPDLPPEPTVEELVDKNKTLNNNRDRNNSYADPYIRAYMQRLYQQSSKVLIVTRDILLRSRLIAQYKQDMEHMSEKRRNEFKIPFIMSPDDCLLIFQARAQIISIICEREETPLPSYSAWWKKGNQDGLINPIEPSPYDEWIQNDQSRIKDKADVNNSSTIETSTLDTKGQNDQLDTQVKKGEENHLQSENPCIPPFLNYQPCCNIDKMSIDQLQAKLKEIGTAFKQFRYIVTDAYLWLDTRTDKSGDVTLCNWTNNIMPTLTFLHDKGPVGILTQNDYHVINEATTPKADIALNNVNQMIEKGYLSIETIESLVEKIKTDNTNICRILFFCKNKSIHESMLKALGTQIPEQESGKYSTCHCIQEIDKSAFISLSKMMIEIKNLSKQIKKYKYESQ